MKPLTNALKITVSSVMPLTFLKAWVQVKPVLPLYHLVSDETVPHVRYLYSYRKIDEFKQEMDFFLKHYSPIGLTELLDTLKNHQPLPDNAFLLSFDDGFSQVYDIIAPILKEKGIPATFFLVSHFLDNRELGNRPKGSLLINAFQQLNTPSWSAKIKEIFLQ